MALMKYQLVLQWPADAIEDFDRLVEVENILVERLSERHDVDGHDMGSVEMNIFIHTEHPTAAFAEVEKAVAGHSVWADLRAAYREESGEDYVVLWPRDLGEFAVR
jgi:hypothetical protein